MRRNTVNTTNSIGLKFPSNWTESDFYRFDEIAAIYEYYAKYPRQQAEMLAYSEMTALKRIEQVDMFS